MENRDKDNGVPRVLIVENELREAEDLARTLKDLGYEISGIVSTGEEAIGMAIELGADLILMDIFLKGEIDGIETAEQIRSRFELPVVYLTAFSEDDLIERAARTEPYGYLTKPFTHAELRSTIQTALYRHKWYCRLKESQEKYRTLVETVPSGVVEMDLFGTIQFANESYCRLLGFTPRELVGTSIFDLVPSDTEKDALSARLAYEARVYPPAGPWMGRHRTSAGNTVHVRVDWDYKRDAQGNLVGFIAVVTDITERQKTRERVEGLNLLLRGLQEPGGLSEKLKRITDGVVEIFDADLARIWIARPGDDCDSVCVHAAATEGPHVCRRRDRCLHLTASSGRYTHIEGSVHRRVPFGCYKIGKVATGEIPRFLINEVTEDPDVHDLAWAKSLGLVSFAGLALLSGDNQPVGVIAVFAKHPLSHDETTLLEGLANTTAQVVQTGIAEEALRKVEVLYRSVIDNIEDVFYRSDKQGNLLIGSPSGAGLFGYAGIEDMIGLPLDSFWVDPRDRDKLIAHIREFGSVKDFEGILKRKDGSTFPASFTAHFYRDERGEIQGTQGIIRDITSRKEAEKQVTLSEERFRLAWETSPDYLSISRLKDGLMVDVNPGFTEITGHTRDEVVGRTGPDLNLWADISDRLKLVSALTRDGRVRDFETKLRRKDGEIRRFSISAGLMTLDGETHFLSIIKDMEEFIRARDALVRSEELFRKYFELGLVGMALTSPEKVWVYVNDRICDMLAYTREELLNTTWVALTHPDDLKPDLERFTRMLAAEIDGYSMETRFIRKDGAVVYTMLHVSCMRRPDETVDNVIVHLYDISDRKQAEKDLHRYTQELEATVLQLRKAEESLSAGEKLLRQVLDLVPHFIFAKDIEGRFILANQAVVEAYGSTMDGLIGKTDAEFNKSEDEVTHFRSDDLEVITRGRPKAIPEEQITDAKGNVRWLSTMKIPFTFAGAGSAGVLGVSVDITERRKAEQDLADGLKRSRLQLETVSEIAVSSALVSGETSVLARKITERGAQTLGVERVGVWLFSDDGEALTCIDLYESSPSAHSSGHVLKKEQFKDEFDALAAERYVDAHDPYTDPRTTGYVETYLKPLNITSMLDAVIRRGRENLGVICFEHVDKAHSWRPDEIAFACQMADQFAIALHNRDRRLSARVIRESERQYRLLAENISDVIWSMTPDLTFTYVSPSAERLQGWTPSEWLAFRPSDYLTPASVELVRKVLEEERSIQGTPGFNPNRVRTLELEHYRKDGSTLWTEVSARFLYDDAGSLTGIIGATRDISERRQSQAQLQRLFAAVQQAGEMIMITEPDGTLLYVNPAFEKTTGYPIEEVLGKPAAILTRGTHNRAFFEDMWSTIKRGEMWRGRFSGKRKDGSLYQETATISPIKDESGRVIHYVMVGRDVTSEMMLQKQLHQAQKMEAIGTLAGGIAHDFNNLLQAILGYSDLLLMKKDSGDPDRPKLKIIQQAARDGSDLVSRILTSSRKGDSKARPIDLNEEIRKARKLLRRTIPRMIEIKLVLHDNLRIIDADPGQVQQTLLNLAVNAHHAMPDGGQLIIETNNASLNDEYLRTHLGAEPGQYVLLTVSDTGVGMEPEVLDRIFEPFFTTKTEGEGTGLGLSMVHGIVSQHGGYIRCYSEPGRGTSFKIYFPMSAGERIHDLTMTREMPAFGTETVLLVDDDDRVRKMGRQMVNVGGYQVITASTGEEALEMYSRRGEDISLVILDLIMPGMGGQRCLEELLRMDPNVRVLVASGCSSTGLTDDEKGVGARGFISKPYDAKDILQAIRRVLDEGHL